ncbi:MAG: hypothetical protein CVT47_00810 [Thermoplasmata archaeon HGW-Thermoplasmata-2]|nr:MAG: hypothetical protein CVT47_00810 [Thermoplasmata archaeon HGW-Thermoplasmata-2]
MAKKLIAMPCDEEKGKDSKISQHFGHCKSFALASIDENEKKILEVRFVKNVPHESGGCGASVRIIAGEKPDAILVCGIGRVPFEILSRLGITVQICSNGTVEDAVSDFVNDKVCEVKDENLCSHHR